ncbi:hypothetical protein BDM02DRAFT_3273539 [Thelephora ganbajun]|uniref:Uncharacterized protein n=1 Tax=Thelephora ganbajun TaxID=370292 RepID=A0ACB6YY92_THEGA|nr:hypothetical protein BDM02DRAFT_3273539 [Thelephora ganbajun]
MTRKNRPRPWFLNGKRRRASPLQIDPILLSSPLAMQTTRLGSMAKGHLNHLSQVPRIPIFCTLCPFAPNLPPRPKIMTSRKYGPGCGGCGHVILLEPLKTEPFFPKYGQRTTAHARGSSDSRPWICAWRTDTLDLLFPNFHVSGQCDLRRLS